METKETRAPRRSGTLPADRVLSFLRALCAHVQGVVLTLDAAVRERLDVVGTIRKLLELGRTHGPAFLVFAIMLEVFEDLVLPALFVAWGKPCLAPLALACHLEPALYPAFFITVALIRRARRRRGGERREGQSPGNPRGCGKEAVPPSGSRFTQSVGYRLRGVPPLGSNDQSPPAVADVGRGHRRSGAQSEKGGCKR